MLRSCSRKAGGSSPGADHQQSIPWATITPPPNSRSCYRLPPDQSPFVALQRCCTTSANLLPSTTYPMLHEPTPEHLPNLRTDRVSPPSPPGPKHRPRVLPKSDCQQSSPSCTDRSQLRSSPPWKSLTSRPSLTSPLYHGWRQLSDHLF
jgi:hypothetical protein